MNTNYYKSHLKLDFIAGAGQDKLLGAKVLVIGAGGLGCPCLSALTASGIGNIGLADGDMVSSTNIQRQTLFNYSDTGRYKTAVAIEALKLRNPYLLYYEHRFYAEEQNILALIEPYDIIIDATDNFNARYLINDACVVKGKPLVYGAIFQAEGHLTVFNHKGSASLRCLFPEEGSAEGVSSCAAEGAYMVATHIIGTMMASEVIKVILAHEDMLAGKLLSFDALNNQTTLTSYHADLLSKQQSYTRFSTITQAIELAAEQFTAKIRVTGVELIDVRTETERSAWHIGGEHIPLSELSRLDLSRFPRSQHFYFYCQTGVRSLQAAKQLRAKGYQNAFSLKNGITNFQYQTKISNSCAISPANRLL